MKIVRLDETVTRHSRINGKSYQFIRMSYTFDPNEDDFVEIVARRWNGFRWEHAHRWQSR